MSRVASSALTLYDVKDGDNADVYKFVYKDFLTKPDKPTDNVATGWLASIPTNVNNTLWHSQGKQTEGSGNYVWQEPVQITAKDGLSALLHDWSGNSAWPYGAGVSIANAYKQTFTSAFSGNAFIRINALDAEGGLQIALNNEVLGTMSGADNETKWYEFASESLVVGTNTLSFWSSAVDGGAIKEVKVAFVGGQGIQGITGNYVDFLFTRKTTVPADPSGADTWYTAVTSVPAGEGALYSIKKNVTDGGTTVTYTDKYVIDSPIIREVVMYSGAEVTAPAVPTTDVTYNFVTDSLLDNNSSWSTSFPSTLANNKKVYRITAIAKGNPTQTSVSLNDQWSTPAVYAHRVDGITPDALTVTASSVGGVTTLAFSDGTNATVNDGNSPDAQGVKIIYATDASGTGASFTQGSKKYANYYEWVGTAPTSIPTGLTYTLFIGTDGDSAGVLPIYSTDSVGTTVSFTAGTKEFVNFYEWTGTAPTTVPTDLTYVKFIGENGDSYTGTTEYYKLTNSATAPTIASGSWLTTPQTPTAGSQYLWNYSLNTRTIGADIASPVSLITQYVKDGKGIVGITESYQLGTSATVAPTGSWASTFAGAGAVSVANPYMWNRTTTSYTEGANTIVTTMIAAKGETGDVSTTPGPQGNRGNTVLKYSANLGTTTTTAAATNCATYWNSVANAEQAVEIDGDTLIVTNTSTTTGWTHIYDFNGTSWVASSTFVVAGNQIVEGTVTAGKIQSDIIFGVDATFNGTVKIGGTTPITESNIINPATTATILSGNVTGSVGGTAVATVTSGAAAGATANQDSTSTILNGDLTGSVDGTAVATVVAGANAGATANQDSNATIRAVAAATSGNVAGWTISANDIYSGATVPTYDVDGYKAEGGMVLNSSGYMATPWFYVDASGAAFKGDISLATGTLTAANIKANNIEGDVTDSLARNLNASGNPLLSFSVASMPFARTVVISGTTYEVSAPLFGSQTCYSKVELKRNGVVVDSADYRTATVANDDVVHVCRPFTHALAANTSGSYTLHLSVTYGSATSTQEKVIISVFKDGSTIS